VKELLVLTGDDPAHVPGVRERLEALGFEGAKVPPSILRYALIANQYLQPMNFTFEALGQAKASVERIQTRYERLLEARGEGEAGAEVAELVASKTRAFDEALADNLNMPNALAALFGLVAELNQRTLGPGDAALALAALEGFDGVLAVLDRRVRSGLLRKEELDARAASASLASIERLRTLSTLDAPDIEAFVVHRHAAKKARDFAAADGLRRELDARGVALEDVAGGVRWRLK